MSDQTARPNLSSVRIVLVDDDAAFRSMLGAVLRREGLEVVAEAADGAAAVALVQAVAPDVVVTDLQMPGVDGIALADVLRVSHPTISVVMVTAFPGPGVIDRAFDAGVRAFLDKHHGVTQLPALIRDVLANAREAVSPSP